MIFKWIGKIWRAQQRSYDVQILWPACKEHSLGIDHARFTFYVHACGDPCWYKDYTDDALKKYVGQLK